MSGADEILAQELAAFAFCWRLDRGDGVTIGLTSHDRDLSVGGVTYRAAPGLVPSAIARGTTLDSESMDLAGALTSDAISEADLAAGRWDGAGLTLHLTEWTEPGALWLELARGTLGAVERQGERFSAELLGPTAALGRAAVPETTPGCRARLGDASCRVDMTLHRRIVRVTAMTDEVASVAGGGMTAGAYALGQWRWLTGGNAGLIQPVVANDAGTVTLADPPPVEESATGRLALLTEGCDKRLTTCVTRFANSANFRGEPYLPGNDLLTRYPGG